MRRYVHVLGGPHNPLVIRDHVFRDAVIELGDEFAVHFDDCIFERAPWSGNLVNLVQRRCSIGDERPPVGPVRMKKVGTAENPIVFHGVTFPYMRIELGAIHAKFSQCRFILCELFDGQNCTFEHCNWIRTVDTTYDEMPMVFYCICGPDIVFGQVEFIPDEDYIYPEHREDVVAKYIASLPVATPPLVRAQNRLRDFLFRRRKSEAMGQFLA